MNWKRIVEINGSTLMAILGSVWPRAVRGAGFRGRRRCVEDLPAAPHGRGGIAGARLDNATLLCDRDPASDSYSR